ncbi:MAG: MFS transporter [Ruminococcaceae bacterium]|nr:MFS transporter [Oscillospiraceae bacterium]
MSYSSTRVACYIGYIVQAIVNNFLPLLFVMFNTSYGLSYGKLGAVVLFNFGVQLVTDILSIKIVSKIGTKRAVIIAHFLCATGLLLLGILPRVMDNTFLGICIATLFSAVGGGLIEVLISPVMDRISGERGRGYMSFLHSFYCWGQILVVLLTTLAIYLFGIGCWYPLSFFWAAVPFFNGLAFIRVPIVEDEPEEKRTPLKKILKTKSFFLLAVLMFTAGASELAMAQWASTFAEQGLGLSKIKGDLLGPCAFALFMGVGRIIHALIPERIDIKTFLLTCGFITLACYLVTSLVDNSIVAVIACALCGLGVSATWPGSYTLASRTFRHGGNAMFGVLAMFGDLGASSGPWLAGLVAAAKGLKPALLACSVFPIMLILILMLYRKNNMNEV